MGTEVGILWEQGYPLASAFGPAMPPAALWHWRLPASGLGLVLLRSLGVGLGATSRQRWEWAGLEHQRQGAARGLVILAGWFQCRS